MYRSDAGKMLPLHMGCYGIGVSRVLAAATEVLSTPSELRWPAAIAPHPVVLLEPKQGSREAAAAGGKVRELAMRLDATWDGEVMLDDRGKLTVGKKLREARKTGYPYIVVAGRGCLEEVPRLEVHCLESGEVLHLSYEEVLAYIARVKQRLEGS